MIEAPIFHAMATTRGGVFRGEDRHRIPAEIPEPVVSTFLLPAACHNDGDEPMFTSR